VQDHDVAVVDVDAGAAQLENFSANGFVNGKIKELIAVVAEIEAGDLAGLEAVGADEFAGFEVADHEMVAERVEGVDIEAGTVGSRETFAQFEVKDVVAETLALN